MGVRSASDSVEEVMDTILKLFEMLKENGSLTGGLKVVRFNPLELDWRIDYPKETIKEKVD
jgi:hypothetical protein